MSEHRITIRPELETAAKEAKRECSELFQMGKRLGEDWIEFYVRLRDFQESVRVGRRKYELCGYGTWEEFLGDLTKRIGESRSELLAKLGAIRMLPAPTVRQLGKVKSFQAVRLVRAGKWSPVWRDRLLEMTVDEAKVAVAKAVGTSNGHFRVTVLLRVGQETLWAEQVERIKALLATDSTEQFWDFLLGHLQNLPDSEITGKQK